MSALTVVSPVLDFDRPLSALAANTSVEPFVLGAQGGGWRSLILEFPRTTLTINSLTASSDPAKHRSAGLAVYMFSRSPPRSPRHAEILGRMGIVAPMFIGFVGTPEFSEDEGHLECLCAVAMWLNGVIFDMNSIRTATGELLLDAAGNFDVAIPDEVLGAFRRCDGWQE